nr:MAG TPA: hypothetical protein [Caudoviricetes sp.]
MGTAYTAQGLTSAQQTSLATCDNQPSRTPCNGG